MSNQRVIEFTIWHIIVVIVLISAICFAGFTLFESLKVDYEYGFSYEEYDNDITIRMMSGKNFSKDELSVLLIGKTTYELTYVLYDIFDKQSNQFKCGGYIIINKEYLIHYSGDIVIERNNHIIGRISL